MLQVKKIFDLFCDILKRKGWHTIIPGVPAVRGGRVFTCI